MTKARKGKSGKGEVSIVRSSAAEYLTFVAAGGGSEASVEMRYEDETIWLTQKMMATLYDVSVPAVNQHLKRIFADNELDRGATVKKYLIVQRRDAGRGHVQTGGLHVRSERGCLLAAGPQRRRLETHPKTGAAQLVEVRQTIQEITVPKYVDAETPAPPMPALFAEITEEVLFTYGVPKDWMGLVREATEDTLLDVADHLPAEAAEALLDLATGKKPEIAKAAAPEADPFEHPDAQRRFRVMHNVEELERALAYPWEKWAVFLHPAQQYLIERDYNGPAKVAGSAGTGKTIVALHRAVYLARSNPEARVLLTTFSEPLANALRTKLRRLISNQPRMGERLEVHAMEGIGKRLYEFKVGSLKLVTRDSIAKIIQKVADKVGEHKFASHFLISEWEQVVDVWQLDTWEAYRDVMRLGRKTRLPENRRAVLWEIFQRVRTELQRKGSTTYAEMYTQLASHCSESRHSPFDFVVVDECQDLSVAQLRFLAALAGERPNALFCAGDLGQRIFQQPFSWKALGVDIRGRSRVLKVNYRTSHQIRMQADRLLDPELSDVDGNTEERRGTISVFNGPKPVIQEYDSTKGEASAVGQWLHERIAEGIDLHEIGIFVRSDAELKRAQAAVRAAEAQFKVLDENVETTRGHVFISTMHLAKGLEFRAVAVMACDDEILPSQTRIESVSDDADLEEVYNTERHLLYVACTRARDHLLVSCVQPGSEFLDDLRT